jgi:hypothetical protein
MTWCRPSYPRSGSDRMSKAPSGVPVDRTNTTISAIANALHLFAVHPEQWRRLKDDPALIPNAVNEIVRYESPLRLLAPSAPRHRHRRRLDRSRRTRTGRLRVRQPRRIRMGSARYLRHPSRRHPSARLRPRRPRLCGAGAREARNPGHAAGCGGTRRPVRIDFTAYVGGQQHHPPTRAATAEADRGMTLAVAATHSAASTKHTTA